MADDPHPLLPIDPDRATTGRTRRAEPRVLAAIALGGALGAPVRYGVAQLILERFPPTRYLRPFVATGFLGAYTTYSTFAVETDLLIKNGHPGIAAAYAAASLIVGFAAVWLGLLAARAVPTSRGTPGEPAGAPS
jgi:CrcB protein